MSIANLALAVFLILFGFSFFAALGETFRLITGICAIAAGVLFILGDRVTTRL